MSPRSGHADRRLEMALGYRKPCAKPGRRYRFAPLIEDSISGTERFVSHALSSGMAGCQNGTCC